MIRALVIIALLALLAMGLSWLADRPGAIDIVWQGWHVKTSLMAATVAVIALVLALTLLIGILRSILRTPEALSHFMRTRRRSRGFNAVTQGMIAVGSGDVRRAQRQAVEAERILGAEPLAILLKAQAAQLSGDRAAAETAFRAMLDDAETRPLGLRGLFVEARRRGDAKAAKALAAEAIKASPTLPWAGAALLEFQSVEKDWTAALATLSRNADNKLIDKETARRYRAVLLTARALDQAERDRSAAKSNALEAVKLAPGLVPAAVLAARLLSDGNDIRRAAKVIEAAWRIEPHPDLARAYMNVRPGDAARDRLARIRTLAAIHPNHPESALALARAALATRDLRLARSSLAPLLVPGATERVYLLMADIEEAEHGSTGRLREWLSRAVRAPRDPAWTADGVVSDVWLPVSPVTGRIDAFEWRTPVERIGPPPDGSDEVIADVDEPTLPAPSERPLLTEASPAPPAREEPPAPSVPSPAKAEAQASAAPPPPAPVPMAAEPVPLVAPPEPSAAPAPAAPPSQPERPAQPSPPRRAVTLRAAPVEAVVATPPTPDDPGPEAEEEPRRRFTLFG
jgi:HemY protein